MEDVRVGDHGYEVVLLDGEPDVDQLGLDINSRPRTIEQLYPRRTSSNTLVVTRRQPDEVERISPMMRWVVVLAEQKHAAGEVVDAARLVPYADTDGPAEIEGPPCGLLSLEQAHAVGDDELACGRGVVFEAGNGELESVLEENTRVDDVAESWMGETTVKKRCIREIREDRNEELCRQMEERNFGHRPRRRRRR